jgi:hypothetical protein
MTIITPNPSTGDPNNPDNGFVECVSVMALPFLAHNSKVSQSHTFASQ